MSDDKYTYEFTAGDLAYTNIEEPGAIRYDLPDEAAIMEFPAGTIVYGWFDGCYKYVEIARPLTLKIEARGATNYDNNRRVVDRYGTHLFWIRGKFLRKDYLDELAKEFPQIGGE